MKIHAKTLGRLIFSILYLPILSYSHICYADLGKYLRSIKTENGEIKNIIEIDKKSVENNPELIQEVVTALQANNPRIDGLVLSEFGGCYNLLLNIFCTTIT